MDKYVSAREQGKSEAESALFLFALSQGLKREEEAWSFVSVWLDSFSDASQRYLKNPEYTDEKRRKKGAEAYAKARGIGIDPATADFYAEVAILYPGYSIWNLWQGKYCGFSDERVCRSQEIWPRTA